jgi:hypothetical protein
MTTAISFSIIRRLAAVTFLALAADTVSATIVASDNASSAAYTDGWQTGDNGGTGFGPWTLSFSGSGNGLLYPPQFIDRIPLPGDSLGAPAFALTTGDQRSAFETSEVRRPLLVPLAVGQTLTANVNGSALDPSAPSFTIGNTFDLLTTNGSERFSLFTNNDYHSNHWTVTGDLDTGIAAGSSFHIDFTLASANTYNLVLSPVTGGAALFTQTGGALAGTAGASIATLHISDYGTGSSSNGSKEYFFDDLMITAAGIPGDYNNNGTVDAADFVSWRATLGQTVPSSSGADGNNNGRIDVGDYDVWRAHFGQSTGASINLPQPANLGIAVPEPAEITTFLLAVFVMIPGRRGTPVMIPRRIVINYFNVLPHRPVAE